MNKRFFVFFLSSLFLLLPAAATGKDQSKKAPAADSSEKKEEKKDLPLTPTRTVEFTTDEGTWISLDVAPFIAALEHATGRKALGRVSWCAPGASRCFVKASWVSFAS